MARYKIYDKTGAEKAEVSKLSYSGTWMQECSLTVTVNAPAPLSFAAGDYIDYRGERFWIDVDPNVKKQARAGYNGSSFVYDDLTFYNAIRELKVCDFLDYVLSGKNIYTYSAASSVVFFASTVEDFANRIQSNLDRLYTGSNKWKILIDDNIKDRSKTFDGAGNQIIRDKTVSISNAKIFDILSEIEDTFHTTYTIRDRVIKIGFAPEDITPTADGETDAFEYYDETAGKRKGLVSLEKAVNSQYSVITRLRAYGSERNMPSRYYANRYTTIVIGKEDMPRYGIISTKAGDVNNNKKIDFTGFTDDGFVNSYTYSTYDWFIKTNVKLPVAFEKVTLGEDDGMNWMYVAKWGGIAKEMFPDPMNVSLRIVSGDADKERTDVTADLVQVIPWRDTSDKGNAKSPIFYLGFRLTRMSSELTNAMADVFASQLCSWSQDSNDYPTIYSISGFCADAFDETYKVYNEKADTLTLSIFNLMLPGFPTKSLQEYVYGTDGEGGNKDLQSWIKECYGKADALDGHLSTDKFFPYIDSPNVDAYGVRESNIYFTEDSDDFDEVYPSIETGWNGNEKNYFTFVDETGETIENSSGYNDQGIFTNVEVGAVGVKVPYAGFDWADVWTDNMALSMKSGMCAGREFTVSKAVNINGVAENGAILFLERAYDENVQRYFPYKDYPLTAKSDADGGDRYVVLNIEMPASYVESAAEVAFKQAVLYLSQHDRPSFIYTPALSSVYIQRERDAREEVGDIKNSVWYKIKEGSAITFKDENIIGAESETHVIKTLSIKEGDGMIPSYEITIQEDEPETKLSALEKQINSLTSSSSATTVGSSSTSTSASRILKTKLNSSWFRELFVAYDKEGNEVKPNSETEIDYIEPIVTLKGQQSSEGEDKGIISADKAKEADHAATADLATKAEQADYATQATKALNAEEADHAAKADQSQYAVKAGTADRAGYADKAGDLADGSPVYDKFLRKDVADTAKGHITLEDGVSIGGEGLYEIDKDGNGTLNLVKMLAAYGLGDVLSKTFSQAEKTGFWLTDNDNSGHSYLEVDKLYVRMKAIFDELEIRKRSYVGGNQIFSCAASRLTDVVWWTAETNDAGERTTDITKIAAFKCYIKTDDGTTETENWWQVDDLAICQTFNINEESTVRDAKNKYYWRKVTDVGKETITHDDGSVEVMGYILLSNTNEGVGYASTGVDHTADATTYGTTKVILTGSQAVVTDGDILTTGTDGTQMPTDFPETDDTIVQLGCADETKGRGNALEIIVYSPSASGSAILEGMTCSAPAIIQYNNITTFSLANKAKVVISPSGNVFKAKSFVIETGEQSVRVPIDLGEWQEGKEYTYYSRVSHGGQLWLLDKIAEDATTTEEPKEGCKYWTCQVEKGEKGESIEGEAGVSSLDIRFTPESLIFETDDDGALTGLMSSELSVTRGEEEYTCGTDYRCVVTAVKNLTISNIQRILYTTGSKPTVKISANDITTYDTGLTDANGNKIVLPYTEGYVDIMVVTFKKPEETQTKRLSWRVNYAKYIGRQTITQKEFKSEYESYTNTNDTNISKMQSAITQNAESVSVVAKKFNDDGTLKNTSGLLTTADASGLFAVDGDGNLKSLVESSQEGVKIKADGNITLEGFTTINDNFKVLTDGSIEANNATISGTVNATEGSIGGFSLSQGKIGVGSDNDATEGLGITNNYLRFASSKQKVLLGCLSTYGSPYNGYFSLTAEDGTTLEVHHDIPSGYEQYEHLSLYRPKALEVYGNIYAKGKQAIFEKGYIGTAYSDTIQQWFPLTHKFQFESNSVTDSGKYLQLFLPSKTAINSLMSNDTVMFDLEIVCGSGMTNYIAIQPDTGKTTTLFRPRHMKITYDYDIDLGKYVYAPSIVSAGTIESYKMYAGDHLRLRYCNGVYYMCTDRIETKYFTGGDLE